MEVGETRIKPRCSYFDPTYCLYCPPVHKYERTPAMSAEYSGMDDVLDDVARAEGLVDCESPSSRRPGVPLETGDCRLTNQLTLDVDDLDRPMSRLSVMADMDKAPSVNELRLGKKVAELEKERESMLVSCL